jgi:uncharacterized protein YkwD
VVLIVLVGSVRFGMPLFFVTAASLDSASLMAKINHERVSRNIPALSTAPKLNVAADGKTRDMFARSYFSHVDPDGNYVWRRVESAGYMPYKMLGENLALDFATEDGVVRAWIDSPTHRDNLLRADFADQGLSAQYGTYENRYTSIVTSLFGTLLVVNPPAVSPPATKPPATVKSVTKPPASTPSSNVEPAAPATPEPAQKTGGNQEAAQISKTPTASSTPALNFFNSEIAGSASGLYEILRVVFMLLVAALILTILVDFLIHRRRDDIWRHPDLPMFIILFLVTLLTIKFY